MTSNPPANIPRLIPYVYYEDVAAALDWLTRAFGFREKSRMTGPDGKVSHAEMEYEDCLVMMGCPGPDYEAPRHAGRVHQAYYIYVDAVDEHFRRARAAGARVLSEPEDKFYGDRSYGVADPEGHHWYFAQHLRDVSPEELAKHPG